MTLYICRCVRVYVVQNEQKNTNLIVGYIVIQQK